WSGTATGLNPGINRVLVQSFNAEGREIDRGTLDVWYDDGSVVNVTTDINGPVTWTAAAGPYNVTVPIGVNDGGELTIEAGNTVFFAACDGITIGDCGTPTAGG